MKEDHYIQEAKHLEEARIFTLFPRPGRGGGCFSSAAYATRLYTLLGLRVAISNFAFSYPRHTTLDMVRICYATAIAKRKGPVYEKNIRLDAGGLQQQCFIPSYFLHRAMLPVHTYSVDGMAWSA